METRKIIVAIDGPAGSGKSTTSRLVAERIGAVYVDTGAMYRAVTLAALRAGAAGETGKIVALLDSLKIRLELSNEGQRTFLNGEDVTLDIRSAETTAAVSFVSSIQEVRKRLVDMQRGFADSSSIVMDGRDIGTVVFPKADVKIYMTASIEARASRRAAEIIASGGLADITEIAQNLEERDRCDQSRNESPLRMANDAIEINTSGLSIEDQVEKILLIIKSKI